MNSLDNTKNKLPYYHPLGKEVEIFQHAFSNKLPLLLKGPTGSGKSRFVEHMAARLERELTTVICTDETSAVDLVGRYIVQGSETIWQDGPLTRAVREGGLFFMDEIAEARPDILTALHSLTDYRRTLFLERNNESIAAPEAFMLIASYNPEYQRGLKELRPSTRQRFVGVSFRYPDPEIESEIIMEESGVEDSTAFKLVEIGEKIRNMEQLGLLETASTRLLVDAGKMIHSGLAPRLACRVAIAELLTDDQDVFQALNDLISLSI